MASYSDLIVHLNGFFSLVASQVTRAIFCLIIQCLPTLKCTSYGINSDVY